jgi:hypothetical protein
MQSNFVAEIFCFTTRRVETLREFRPQRLLRHAEINQRAQKHVAADARKAVEIEKFHALPMLTEPVTMRHYCSGPCHEQFRQ